MKFLVTSPTLMISSAINTFPVKELHNSLLIKLLEGFANENNNQSTIQFQTKQDAMFAISTNAATRVNISIIDVCLSIK